MSYLIKNVDILSLSLFKRGPVVVSYLYKHVDILSLSLFKRGSVIVLYLYIHVDLLFPSLFGIVVVSDLSTHVESFLCLLSCLREYQLLCLTCIYLMIFYL